MGNNVTEQSIRWFYIGKKNWGMIDVVARTKSSAIIYSIAEITGRLFGSRRRIRTI